MIDFAKENLFKPLGIKVPNNTFIQNKEDYLAFLKDKYITGWGLTLTLRDMIKIGPLNLNGAVWNGKQILSSKWIEDSTKEKKR